MITREDFFASVQAYKKGEKKSQNSKLADWKDQFLHQAAGTLAKGYLSHSSGYEDDAEEYDDAFNSLMHSAPITTDDEEESLFNEIHTSAVGMLNKVQHGGAWKNHKYIRIENGRYIYPEDDKATKQLEKKLDKAASDSAKAISSGSKEDQVNAHNQYARIVEGYGLDSKDRGNTSRGIENKFGEKVSEKLKENAQKGEGGSYNQAQSSMAGYDEWKKKDSFDRKADQTKQVIENAKTNMEMKQKVQEREVLQAQKDYEANIDKYAKDTLNSVINQFTKGNSANYNDPDLDAKLYATGYDIKTISEDYVKKLTELWDQKKQSVDPSTRSKLDSVISSFVLTSTGQSIKPKKLGHSIEPLSKDEYYAAVQQYKANQVF